ncbi:rho guanine nucleotide exchange factor 17 [Pituophis catenifer annectens]|uniref:rho guanine nucleotide exchange factor 17 n=1 Tax=Pituophis catenifer annectens TaxID=94852 RepID=UPI00399296D0
MAEGAPSQKRTPLYRSVSFQRLAKWTGPAQPDGGGGGDPRGQPPLPPPPEPIGRRSPGRAASFSVSSRPAPAEPAGRALRSLSPSVRQLSQRFCPPRAAAGSEDQPPPAAPAGRGRATCARPAAAAQKELGGSEAGGTPPPEQPPAPPPRSSSTTAASSSCKGPGEAPAPDWPSVTEMRKLFGESFRRQQLQAAERGRGGPAEEEGGGWRSKTGPPSGSDHLPGAPLLPDGGPCWAEERRGVPPPPPPRSCIPFAGLRAPRGPSGPSERPPPPPQLWDTSHSWHSSALPAAASPSPPCPAWGGWVPPEVSSSSEDELRPLPRGKSPPRPSSGSEEEEEEEDHRMVPHNRRCLERKKRETEAQVVAGMEWHLKAQLDLSGGLLAPQEEERTTPEAKGGSVAEGLRPLLGVPPEGGRPFLGTPAPLSSGPPLPLVSRVSKVNIPPFASSPAGSRSSSRYSSTETLKEDDQPGVFWTGPSKLGLGLGRTPSFNPSDSPARLQPPIRARPKLPLGLGRSKQELSSFESLLPCGLEPAARSKHQKSMSNPDIASETMALLSFLKSDLSELKAKKRGSRLSDQEDVAFGGGNGDGVSRYEHYPQGGTEHQLVGRSQGEVQPPNRWVLGHRPTLKDLTATLRRAKSFTYSDKPASRRLCLQNAMKSSSSELLLTTRFDHNGVVSDSRDREEEVLPVIIQDQYIQEARQVFEKISKIGSEHDYNFALESKERGKDGTEEGEEAPNEESCGQCLEKAGSEGNLSCRKSLEEGPESSMTDEGIVTEPETSPAYSYLDPSVAAWKLANRRGTEAGERKEKLLPNHLTKGNENVAVVEEVLPNHKTVSQGLPETPLTPSALRRRRKFPSLGNNGSESSNGSSGESTGDSYRSLSDPMPHRRCSITEDSKNFSVDSNLLGSLNSKPGVLDASAAALSDCTGSAASDLSVCSDGLKDYNTVIQNIVSQPGAMDKVIDEKGNGKPIKKKSFSDPSRRGEHASPGFMGAGEPINEMEQNILPSSSEPILLERRGQSTEQEAHRLSSQSEQILPMPPEDNEVPQNFSFDPKLAEVLSPRIVRRSSKKRSDRANSQDLSKKEEMTLSSPVPTTLGRARPASKHVRHTSEPATFLPISDAHLPSSLYQNAHPAIQELPHLPTKPSAALQVPSLEDVTKRYMLTLSSGETLPNSTVDTPRSSPSTPTTTEPKLPRCPKHHGDLNAISSRTKPQVDMRKHVTMTLLDTEQSYVESLRTLMQGYMKPLKQPENSTLCDPSLVDEIFDQIPELLEHHEEFLEDVSECVHNWHEKQKVGEILVESFSKDNLVNIYSAYIDNFLNAKDAIRIAKEARPAFMKFLAQSMRENKEKQALSDLLIKPVQRIPRYELLVKDLLKHTSEEHPDYPFLIEAQKSIKQVAEKINKGMKSAEEVERNARIVQEIESHIEGMEDLQAPLRRFLRQEMVVEVKAVGGKKDRSLFLFTDLLVCTTLKRKSGSLRRSSMSLYTAASVIDTASKYKLLWKMPLEDVEIVKGSCQSSNRDSIQKVICRLDEDLSTLGQVSKLSEALSFPHQTLDDVIKDLMAAIHRELTEKQSVSFSLSFPPNKMELTVTKSDSTDSHIFEFPNPDARHSFEQSFEDAKKKLASNKNCLDPEFLKAIPIMKTRSGMQFSCASPSHSNPENAYEVWVCNSDGYVGQVCLLSIKKEPIVEACIAVCSARILCIASVPGLKRTYRERPVSLASPASEPANPTLDETVPQPCLHISISGSSLEISEPMDTAGRELVPFDSDDTDDESSPSPSGTLQSHSTVSSFTNEEIPSSKDVTVETTSSEEEQDPSGFLPIGRPFGQNQIVESPMDGRAMRRSSQGSFTRASLEDLLSVDPEAYQSSMWLGTEDGCIHVYQSSDNIRNRKNSLKMQHTASVTCILYLDNQVFVSLANGELVAYQREAGRFWDSQNSKSLLLGSPGNPVTKMVAVGGKLWCGCQNRIVILKTSTLLQEHTFLVGQDSNRSVTCLVTSSVGIWVSLQGSAQVRLYHPASYDQLAEVDVTPPVHKMLAGSDAIIRQHKAACLRITSLLACKDLLWIGTSAGVVLTLPITGNPAVLKTPLLPVGLSQGHTGHVRFLTSVELPEGFNVLFPLPGEPGIDKSSESDKRDSTRHRSSKSKMLVVSGGDGYEDFRLTNSSETVGRDDSTNHLLLWRV